MATAITYRALSADEKNALLGNGCSASDWNTVQVEDGFDPARVKCVEFAGKVNIGRLDGSVDVDGVEKPAGLYNAFIADCVLGRNVRIASIRGHLAHYEIADGVCIEDVGTMTTRPGATFGNGVEVEVLNEGGGREVILFDELCAQFAHLLCLHRFQRPLVERLTAIARDYAAARQNDRGRVGRNALILSVGEIEDVNVEDSASIHGAAQLRNGTVLRRDAKTVIGSGVQAEDFIFAEGCSVTGASVMTKCFVGQGCQIGRQFSAENSLFFANCEGFHGEAVAVFAGPYSVTHHKSSLLIAGWFSFYNAGSGTNQSNHMYKLGPVHEGKLERGCKTGSFSYMMWPCRVGAFSIVLGKHKRHFDTADFPFSVIEADADGRCNMVPGLNLATVGTVRDGAKWPSRDRRKGKIRRDRISFDVLSPYTVGRMINSSGVLKQLQEDTKKSIDEVHINGATVKRVLLRTAQKFYRTGIEIYLLEQVVRRAERALANGGTLADAFAEDDMASTSDEWLDISGQLMPRARLEALVASVIRGEIADVDSFRTELDGIRDQYPDDEWSWARRAYQGVFGRDLENLTDDEIMADADALMKVKGKFLRQVLADAKKEFDDTTGFGHGGTADDIVDDFSEVRGNYEQNKFVKQIQEEVGALELRISKFKTTIQQQQAAKSSP